MGSFATLATVACSTKRVPAFTGNKRGDAVAKLSGLYCTPLDPVNPQIDNLPVVESPFELLQTFVQGAPDIVEGDTLVVGSTEYRIQAVADWVWRDDTFRRLFLEELK